MYDQLLAEGQRTADADAACNYLCHFVLAFNDDGSADPRRLSGARDDLKRARSVWQRMITDNHQWNPRHRARVRRRLSAALRHVVVSVAHAIDPRLQPPGPTVAYSVDRSQQRRFTLHECLPRRVVTLGSGHPDYRLLARLVDDLAVHLRSVSRSHLQHIAGFLDGLIFIRIVARNGALTSADSAQGHRTPTRIQCGDGHTRHRWTQLWTRV